MPRWAMILVGAGVLVLAGLLAFRGVIHKSATPAPVLDGAVPTELSASSVPPSLSAPVLGSAGPEMPTLPSLPLPDKAPSQVRFGVVLITYAGAQGAGEHARSQHDALELAQKLASEAKSDFHGAVLHGDAGSTDDIGHMPRGVLEPPLEYTLFTMPVGAVSEPLATPRGYWIVKRIE